MPLNPRFLRALARTAITLLLASPTVPVTAQDLLFDGDFESGTFQGWTPGGDNGGSALIAAKNSCYSSNDTTGISFNGNPANNFAALLRSNAAGEKTSVARLRSNNFPAGRGILFSALSETSDANASDDPSDLTVRILDSEGKVLSALPVETAVVQLAVGCPSVKRDTAFAVHYIDTSQHNGEISVEFSQHTNKSGFAYFTLIDNVVRVEKDQVFVNQSLPVARAGTGLTSSGILYLDPRDSYDPDNAPLPLDYSWFINGEGSVRYRDIPCVNVNSDFELGPGNHVATLYVTDGFNYAADTIRFPVTSGQTVDEIPATSEEGITLTTPKGDPIVQEVNLVSEDGVTQTDPLEECDVDVAEDTDEDTGGGDDEDGEGSDGLSIDVDASSESTFDNTFTVGGSAVDITSNNVEVNSGGGDTVTRITVTITNAASGDGLVIEDSPSDQLDVSGSDSSSVSIEPGEGSESVNDSEYESVLEAIQFSYTVPDGQDANTTQRNISYTVSDEEGQSASTNSTITVEN